MSPRPRKASDAEILAAAHRVMSRLGPAQWTLTDIAAEAGLTAGALVQRFGSKHGLLVVLTEKSCRIDPADVRVDCERHNHRPWLRCVPTPNAWPRWVTRLKRWRTTSLISNST